jgi:hypothetical protein
MRLKALLPRRLPPAVVLLCALTLAVISWTVLSSKTPSAQYATKIDTAHFERKRPPFHFDYGVKRPSVNAEHEEENKEVVPNIPDQNSQHKLQEKTLLHDRNDRAPYHLQGNESVDGDVPFQNRHGLIAHGIDRNGNQENLYDNRKPRRLSAQTHPWLFARPLQELLDHHQVPNQVFYVWCQNATFTFQHYLSVLSVWKLVEPDKIEIHRVDHADTQVSQHLQWRHHYEYQSMQ